MRVLIQGFASADATRGLSDRPLDCFGCTYVSRFETYKVGKSLREIRFIRMETELLNLDHFRIRLTHAQLIAAHGQLHRIAQRRNLAHMDFRLPCP